MQRIKKFITKNKTEEIKKEPEKLTAVFVYGTLMSGYGNHRLLEGVSFEKATLLDFRRIWERCHSFPVVEYRPGHYVAGELYYVTKERLQNLDRLEGNRGNEWSMYTRIKVKIITENPRIVEAFVYYPNDNMLADWKRNEERYLRAEAERERRKKQLPCTNCENKFDPDELIEEDEGLLCNNCFDKLYPEECDCEGEDPNCDCQYEDDD